MADPVIRTENLTKSYDHGLTQSHVLRRVSVEIRQGEFVSIMGPSGSGKSTLLHILGMLDEPTSGEYHFFDEPVHRMSARRKTQLHREHIGFVFQAYHLIDDLTVYENLETPLLYRKIKGAERKSIVADALDRFNMVAKKDLFPSQLSGGQQQMVGVARALVIQPKLILADEPTGNLHSTQGDEIMTLLRQLNQEEGVTIVQVTHNEDYAAYGDRVVELLDGRVEREYEVDTAMG
ncbi:MAG: ABC transporter ATP-binding protein [Rhodothermales bacterium]|nr:ABC transporter ATP-binding protein [Rhodothermales bacterium]MBO6780674.1 ABC transporter ATP-binding protein [Rhodothermales bacterium]